jgi:hypothetical protein
MNDLNVVVTLKGAIQALEKRDEPLAPIEKIKLKALRLNLEAAQRAEGIGASCPQPQGRALDPLDARFRTLHALSVTALAEARSLLQDVRQQIARARSLTDEVRLALTRSEHTCATLNKTLAPIRYQAPAASYLPARECSWPNLGGLPSS